MRCALRIAWGSGWGNMSKRQEPRRPFVKRLTKLAVDTTGNTMMIMGIALIPIIGMVGSAFDMGRAYMVKTRLQQACDAGTLAGRKAMTTTNFDTDTAAKTQATNFFNFNFPDGSFGTSGRAFTPRGTSDGQVEADARVTVPMTLMRLFKTQSVTINVDCEAIFEIANTDIVFVLDVTQSMNCAVGTSGGCASEVTSAKIKALRLAVVSFYDTLKTAIGTDARLRFGFVPYSTTVNVGKSLPAEYLKPIWSYQSRERVLKSWSTTSNTSGSWPSTGSSTPTWGNWSAYTQVSNTSVSGSWACTAPATTYEAGPESSSPSTSTNASSGAVTTTTVVSRTMTQTSYQATYTSSGKMCKIEKRTRVRNETKTDTKVDTPDYDWHYKRWQPPQELYDTYKSGADTIVPIGNASSDGPATNRTTKWNGCIEEAATVANTTFSTLPVSGAFDLDIDLVPATDAQRWAPAWIDIIYYRNKTGTAYPDTTVINDNNSNHSQPLKTSNEGACPKAAQKLKVMTKTEIEDYLKAANGFLGLGYTYHDTGMIWGGRFISPDGIFASENREVPTGEVGAGKPINRHIIYMTDGQLQTNDDVYGLYGLESLDGRIAAGASDLTSRHRSRFNAVCNSIKSKNITVWVIAYAATLDTSLTNCASPGKSFTADDDTELDAQFKAIANKIAELRLQR